jgi:plasmid stabilization system protein ParE
MKLSYHPAAESEVVQAAKYYQRRVHGLGAQFLDEFDRSIGRILASPTASRIVAGDKRRFLMPRFPYGIYYRIAGDEVRILVVKHHSQHPGFGMGRE